MDKTIAKKLSTLAREARRKANYLRLRPSNTDVWNYEQEQGGVETLEDIAKQIEQMIASYFVYTNLMHDKKMMEAISYDCHKAIQREIHRSQTWDEYAELR